MKQQTVKQFTPFFSPKTRQESYTPGRGAGHKFYCHKCGEFRVHSIEMVGNGTPILRSKCRYCGSYDEFIRAGGQWVPSSVVELLDSFVMKEMDKKSAEMWSEAKLVDEDGIKSDEEVTDEPSPTEQDLSTDELDVDLDEYTGSPAWMVGRSGLDLRTRKERFKAWMTCKRYLMVVAGPVAGLLAVGVLGVLAKLGVYVHPIYEWLAPYYRPWMANDAYTFMPVLGAAILLLAYIACRRLHQDRVELDPESLRQGKILMHETETLQGIDEL